MPSARAIAVTIVQKLQNAGFTAYFAGGCVRDELLGLRPEDYDVATDARPDDVRALFRRTNEVGVSFGVMLVRESGHTIEVTTFREEGAYADRRRPNEVRYADAPSDANRRDFTINALFLDPLAQPDDTARRLGVDGLIIDYVNGVQDLRARVIRAVGDPDQRLAEDHLRALRAVRFAARLGFTIDSGAADAIRRHARQLEGVSRERIGDEFRKMLIAPTRAAAAHLIESLGLDEPSLREPPLGVRAPNDLGVLAQLPQESSFPLALAAWAVERHLRRLREARLEELWPHLKPIPGAWRRALCLSNDERDALRDILGMLPILSSQWPDWDVPTRKRLAAAAHFDAALTLHRILDPVAAASVREELDRLQSDGVGISPDPFLTGDDLIALGFRPGPTVGAALRQLYDLQLAGEVRTLDDARQTAKSLQDRPFNQDIPQ